MLIFTDQPGCSWLTLCSDIITGDIKILVHVSSLQSLSELQQEVSRKERSLRILGKHLSGVQKKRKQLHERLQRAQDELGDAIR